MANKCSTNHEKYEDIEKIMKNHSKKVIYSLPLAPLFAKKCSNNHGKYEHIKTKKIPVICFPKGIGENYLDFCSIVKPDCISIDYEVDPKWIKEKLKDVPIQGGLDPKILLGDKEGIKKNTEKYLNIFKDYPYIFNLGHGVLPLSLIHI